MLTQSVPQFTDSDVVNIDDYIPAGEYNPHNVRPWLLHEHGFVIAVMFAENLQDALDEAVDENKLDAFMIEEKEYADYGVGTDKPSCVFLGNNDKPFDIDCLDAIELPNPPMSFRALWDAMK